MLILVGTAAFTGPVSAKKIPPAFKSDSRAVKIALAAPVPKTAKLETAKETAPDPNLPPKLANGTASLNPELLKRFDAFRTFIFQKYGVVLEVKSGFRSSEEQAYLYRTLPRGMANPPGQSPHEKGEAIDYTPPSPTYNQHLPAFGLRLPFPGVEEWHIERADY